MSEEQELPVAEGAESGSAVDAGVADPPVEPRMALPVESRFMFVDIASLRAKQLRRGAVPRVPFEGKPAEGDAVATPNLKLERIAMAEVENCLIIYHLPSEHDDAGEQSSEVQPS